MRAGTPSRCVRSAVSRAATASLAAFIAERGGAIVGLATFRGEHDACELVTLDAPARRQGVGSWLLAGVVVHAREQGCRRVRLVTSNDNLDALRFYQRRGMRIVAVHPGAVDAARLLKASIPAVGNHAIPIYDELEPELELEPAAGPLAT